MLYEHRVPSKGHPGQEKFMKANVALQNLSNGINQASAIWKTKGSAETQLFFTCLDKYAGTEPAKWFQGMKDNAARLESERQDETGAVDMSATPIGLEDMQRIGYAANHESIRSRRHPRECQACVFHLEHLACWRPVWRVEVS
jgi:hypothetical protein